MIVSCLSVLKKFSYDKIWEGNGENDDKFTLVHAWYYWEPGATIASDKPETVSAHIQAVDECACSLVCKMLASSVRMIRYRDHDHVHQIVRGSVVRRYTRAFGYFDHAVDLNTSVDPARSQLSVGVPRTSHLAAVQALSRSRARTLIGARKFFPRRPSCGEEIELDENWSPTLETTSWELSIDGVCAFLRYT